MLPIPVRTAHAPGSWFCLLSFLAMLALPAAPRSAPATAVPAWADGPGFRSHAVQPESRRPAGFTRLGPGETGVAFTNLLTGDAFLTNFVAHNGSGVAVGDVDGDGWPDLYCCALQGPNRLFLNRGGWRFEARDGGPEACPDQASTGAAFADVDGDGDADLLVNGIGTGTRLFLNDGRGTLSEAADSGLSRAASSTSLALADIDGDGDLDLYCAHYIDVMHLADPTTRFALAKRDGRWTVAKINGEPATLPRWKDRFEALPDGSVRELPEVHGLYRNDGAGKFTAVIAEPGRFLDELGRPMPPPRDWGLAAMFRDWTGDGAPDLYVCNDNASPDRIWINTGRGVFRAAPGPVLRHTSRSSMALDFADVNRDGWDDFFTTDMLSRDPVRRMMQQVRERPDPAEVEQAEARPRFNRNMLQFGRPDGTFAEAALQAGVAATDWSWCPVFLDVDLDGYEDLLVNSGFDMDVMDQDSHDQMRGRARPLSEAERKRSRRFHPPFRTRSAAFRNRGDGRFEPADADWGFDFPGVAHGAALGDFDRDGDLDVVVNALNDAVLLYRNESARGRVAVRLAGAPPNTGGIGARIRLLGGPVPQSQEMMAGGRYLSGDEPLRVFAADPAAGDRLRLEVRWRSGATSLVEHLSAQRVVEVREPARSTPSSPPPPALAPTPSLFAEVSDRLNHIHADPPFDDDARQRLLPVRLSRLGPGIAWTDLDGDGWDDLVVGSGRGGSLGVFINDRKGGFAPRSGPPAADGDFNAVVGWTDREGHRGVWVAESPEERPEGGSASLLLVPGDPKAEPRRMPFGPAVPGPLAVADIDGDGDLDLFAGGRFLPGRVPVPADAALWIQGSEGLAPAGESGAAFRALGLASGATFADLDGDGDPDLALACDWGAVRVFENRAGSWTQVTAAWGLEARTGWWSSVVAGDFDGDGRLDLAVGNRGRNTIHELNGPGPVRAWYFEGGDGGRLGWLEAWSEGPTWRPLRSRAELATVLPDLPFRFTTHRAFGEAEVAAVLGPRFNTASWVEVNTRESGVLLNRGGRFDWRPFPVEAQRSPVRGLNVADFDGDGREDLFLAQNDFGSGSDLTREDAGRGLWLRGDGQGGFEAVSSKDSGLAPDGEQRGSAVSDFNHDGRADLVVTQNRGATRLFVNQGGQPGLRVLLAGPRGNPAAVGAQLRVVYSDGQRGPVRALQAGSGYGSQDGLVPVLGFRERPAGVWVRWPGGREETLPVPSERLEVRGQFLP